MVLLCQSNAKEYKRNWMSKSLEEKKSTIHIFKMKLKEIDNVVESQMIQNEMISLIELSKEDSDALNKMFESK